MYYKLIILCIMATTLCGCSKHGQESQTYSGTCNTIRKEMVRAYPHQIQHPTAINKAKLLRDYEYYNCDQ